MISRSLFKRSSVFLTESVIAQGLTAEINVPVPLTKVMNGFSEFTTQIYVIVVNCMIYGLIYFVNKIYSRDLFGVD
jgi:uncharacterized membrane protein YkvI